MSMVREHAHAHRQTDRPTERDFNASISGQCCASSPGMWRIASKTEHTLLRCGIASYPAISIAYSKTIIVISYTELYSCVTTHAFSPLLSRLTPQLCICCVCLRSYQCRKAAILLNSSYRLANISTHTLN